MTSAEDILNKMNLVYYTNKEETDLVEGSKKDIIESMDEYAKGVTMDFCRWVLGRIDVIYRPIWKDAWEGMRPTKGRIENEIISDDDLYQQYIESLNNQSKI